MSNHQASPDSQLLRHSGGYLVARAVPALLSFGTLVLFTHILSPADYGYYALVIAGVALAKVLAFSWLEMAALRMLPASADPARHLLPTTLALFGWLMAGTAALALPLAWWLWPHGHGGTVLMGLALLWVSAWLELALAMSQARLRPRAYGLLMTLRAAGTLLLGYLAIAFLGLGGHGALLGVFLGSVAGGVVAVRLYWMGVRPRTEPECARTLAAYGVPLVGTLALALLLDAGDRFMIAAFLGDAAVGPYAAAYDLPRQTLGVVMMVVNLAAYPLAMHAWEQGRAAAQRQIRANASLLLAVSLPACVGLVMVSHDLVLVFFGAAFEEVGRAVMPLAAVGVFIACLCPYLFDLAFQLSRRTRLQVIAPASAAVVNLVLNFFWIPRHGVEGAAWATVVSSLVALLVCIVVGRRLLPIDLDWRPTARILAAVGLMTAALWSMPEGEGASTLALRIVVGALVYGAAALALNVLDSRSVLLKRWRARNASGAGRIP